MPTSFNWFDSVLTASLGYKSRLRPARELRQPVGGPVLVRLAFIGEPEAALGRRTEDRHAMALR